MIYVYFIDFVAPYPPLREVQDLTLIFLAVGLCSDIRLISPHPMPCFSHIEENISLNMSLPGGCKLI